MSPSVSQNLSWPLRIRYIYKGNLHMQKSQYKYVSVCKNLHSETLAFIWALILRSLIPVTQVQATNPEKFVAVSLNVSPWCSAVMLFCAPENLLPSSQMNHCKGWSFKVFYWNTLICLSTELSVGAFWIDSKLQQGSYREKKWSSFKISLSTISDTFQVLNWWKWVKSLG